MWLQMTVILFDSNICVKIKNPKIGTITILIKKTLYK